jgi:hypothetical protein
MAVGFFLVDMGVVMVTYFAWVIMAGKEHDAGQNGVTGNGTECHAGIRITHNGCAFVNRVENLNESA